MALDHFQLEELAPQSGPICECRLRKELPMFSYLRTGVTLVTVLVLTGCTKTVPPAAALADCGASQLQGKISQPVTGSTAEDAMVGGVLVTSKGDVRVIAPGQAVIQNFSETRLNLETDAAGNLVRVSCG
jgi:hypothetical protein